MESFLNRYRNISVLLLAICGQLVLLGLQKNDKDVPVIRTWAVTTVMPVAHAVEWVRDGTMGFFRSYFVRRDASEENRRLREELGRLRIENTFLKNDLATADRAKALQIFQERTTSHMLAGNVIGIGAGSNSKVVYVNRGSREGVMRGMAVVTPDGIVGKVIASYPTASEVLLITDSDFAAGVMLAKAQSHGTLKGQGTPLCKVEYVAFEDKVEPGDWFYTSGDDRIFPRGFLVGVVKSVKPGQPYKEILLEPSGIRQGLEDVLIILSGTPIEIPDTPPTSQPVFIAPPSRDATPGQEPQQTVGTEADKLRSAYKTVGEEQNHFFGEGTPGSRPPDFSKVQSTPPLGNSPATTPSPAANRPPVAAPTAGRNPGPAPTGPAPPKSPPAEPARRTNPSAGAPGPSHE